MDVLTRMLYVIYGFNMFFHEIEPAITGISWIYIYIYMMGYYRISPLVIERFANWKITVFDS